MNKLVGELISHMRSRDLGFEAEDALDAIWLVTRGYVRKEPTEIPSSVDVPKPPTANPKPTAPRDETREPIKPSTNAEPAPKEPWKGKPETSVPSPPLDVFAKSHGSEQSGKRPARRIAIAEAPAVARRLDFDRALRPLRSLRPSRTHHEIDEDASVEGIVESGTWNVVMRPTLERWLDITLVIERSPTMSLWQDTGRELQEILARGTRARSVSVCFLEHDRHGLRLLSRNGQPMNPRLDATRSLDRLVLLLSDGFGTGWLTAEIPELLHAWSQKQPTVLLQVLPPALWYQTSLRNLEPTFVSRSHYLHRPVPLLAPLTPERLAPFSAYLAGSKFAQVQIIADHPDTFREATPDELWKGSSDRPDVDITKDEAIELCRHFEEFASREALELARYLASAPLLLPVMRLIQRVFVPDAAPSQLAELFQSGLLRRVGDPARESSPTEAQEYEFIPGVRDRLVEQGGLHRRFQVIDQVSNYLENRFGKGKTFLAWVAANPEDAGNVSDMDSVAGLQPFARIGKYHVDRLGLTTAHNEETSVDSENLANGRNLPDLTYNGPEKKRLPKTIRIFVSAAADVAPERALAERVIADLQQRYQSSIRLEAFFWEQEPVRWDASFEKGINEFNTVASSFDIALFIVWSRLGNSRPKLSRRKDGSEYSSSFEMEFDFLLRAADQRGGVPPRILAYVRDDEEAFARRMAERQLDDVAEAELLSQRRLVKMFIEKYFRAPDAQPPRACHSYKKPDDFVQRLQVHLSQALSEVIGVDHYNTQWTGSPYRGLEVFDIQHAPIFCGRDDETRDVLQLLHDQQVRGCAFVCIIGPSGSGKSSLARAGVAATLLQRSTDDGSNKWCAAVLVPGYARNDIFLGLARTLANALPALNEGEDGLGKLARNFEAQNHEAACTLIEAAFNSQFETRNSHVLLVLDQMEELWTDPCLTWDQREHFLQTLEALAGTDRISILSTLRSDFYQNAHESITFLRMKGAKGHFDLGPPASAALQQIVVEPARRAGLRFERSERTGRSLDELILSDATRGITSLPLLQFALAELYERRDDSRKLLTFASYERVGGLGSALSRRFEELIASLPEVTQRALDTTLPYLVTTGTTGDQTFRRREAELSDLMAHPGCRELVEVLTRHRFIVIDSVNNQSRARFAQEAILRSPRILQWINHQQETLRTRAQIESRMAEGSPLVPDDPLFEKAEKLLAMGSSILSSAAKTYIAEQIGAAERKNGWLKRLTKRFLGPKVPSVPAQTSASGRSGTQEQTKAALTQSVFVSYSQEDQDAAQILSEALKQSGFEVWWKHQNISGGAEWMNEVSAAIQNCSVFLAIVSENTASNSGLSAFVRKEWDLALQKEHGMASRLPFLIPVVIDRSTPEETDTVHLAERQWFDCPRGVPSSKLLEQINHIARVRSGDNDL